MPDIQRYPNVVIWLDNCSGQNKNWTLLTTLACLMGERESGLEGDKTVTLKFFEAGHTFMAADSFHARVEKEFRKMKNIYDFSDYISCVRRAGICIEMKPSDFLDLKSGMSQFAQIDT